MNNIQYKFHVYFPRSSIRGLFKKGLLFLSQPTSKRIALLGHDFPYLEHTWSKGEGIRKRYNYDHEKSKLPCVNLGVWPESISYLFNKIWYENVYFDQNQYHICLTKYDMKIYILKLYVIYMCPRIENQKITFKHFIFILNDIKYWF